MQMMASIKKLIQDYLKKARAMQISTSVNNKPWCATVYYVYDKNWNLYWISKPSTRHSKEIGKNAKVAGAIVYDQVPSRTVRGLQFEGVAELLSGVEEEVASKVYIKQMSREKTLLDDIRSGKNPHKFYRIKPSKFVLFDRENFPINDERKEYII
jgi:uncharacterized protein YhbP (UPF0306 family)